MRKHLKKLMLAVLYISAVLLLSSCAKSDAAKYTDAQKLLTQGKYAEAVAAFTEIENYEDSSKYVMYVKAVQLAEQGQHDLAINSLKSLKDFKDSELLVVYYGARRYEAEQQYEDAADVYETIATFKDSAARFSALPDLILQREFAKAEIYLSNGNTSSAVYLLEDLADQQYTDSKTRMLQDIHDLAEKSLQEAKSSTAAEIFSILAVRDYKDSENRMKDSQYAFAIEEMEKGEYSAAVNILGRLSQIENYAPAEDTLKECLYRWAIQNASSGDYAAAYGRFTGLQDYKDSTARAREYEEKYAVAVTLLAEGKYDDANAAFTALKNYADSAEKAKESQYLKAIKLRAEENLDDAIALFSSLNDYSDSEVQVKEIQYLMAKTLLNQGDYDKAHAAFSTLGDYSDSVIMVKESAYQKAKALVTAGRYEEAAVILTQIQGYKDVASLIAGDVGLSSAAAAAAAAEFERKWSVGNTVTFGNYEQDNNTANGKEPVRWRVLKREGDKALLISEMNLDCKRYNTSDSYVTWEKSTLRAWLNGTFINAAFNTEEQKGIMTTTLQNEDNPEYKTDGGNPTQDRVFLLSIGEAEALFRDDASRVGKNTAYAKAQGAYMNDSGAGWWWLRSPGDYQNTAALVHPHDSVYRTVGVFVYGAVRPAFWLNLTSGIFSSEAQ